MGPVIGSDEKEPFRRALTRGHSYTLRGDGVGTTLDRLKFSWSMSLLLE